jgi:uncharacterized membrane protein
VKFQKRGSRLAFFVWLNKHQSLVNAFAAKIILICVATVWFLPISTLAIRYGVNYVREAAFDARDYFFAVSLRF